MVVAAGSLAVVEDDDVASAADIAIVVDWWADAVADAVAEADALAELEELAEELPDIVPNPAIC